MYKQDLHVSISEEPEAWMLVARQEASIHTETMKQETAVQMHVTQRRGCGAHMPATGQEHTNVQLKVTTLEYDAQMQTVGQEHNNVQLSVTSLEYDFQMPTTKQERNVPRPITKKEYNFKHPTTKQEHHVHKPVKKQEYNTHMPTMKEHPVQTPTSKEECNITKQNCSVMKLEHSSVPRAITKKEYNNSHMTFTRPQHQISNPTKRQQVIAQMPLRKQEDRNVPRPITKQKFHMPVMKEQHKVHAPVMEENPEVHAPEISEQFEVHMPVLEEQHKVHAPVMEEQFEVHMPVLEEQHKVHAPVMEEQFEVHMPVLEEQHKVYVLVMGEHHEVHVPVMGEQHEVHELVMEENLALVMSEQYEVHGLVKEEQYEMDVAVKEDQHEVPVPVTEEQYEVHVPVMEEQLDTYTPVMKEHDIHVLVMEEHEIHMPVMEEHDIHMPVMEEKYEVHMPVMEEQHEVHMPVMEEHDIHALVMEEQHDIHVPVMEEQHEIHTTPVMNDEEMTECNPKPEVLENTVPETVYQVNYGHMLYLRFPAGVPPFEEIMKLHPGIINVLFSVYDAARFCYLVFANKAEASNARNKLTSMQSAGKLSMDMNKSLEKIITETRTRRRRRWHRFSRAVERENAGINFGSQYPRQFPQGARRKYQNGNPDQQRQRKLTALATKEREIVLEIKSLNKSLMHIKQHKFLLRNRRADLKVALEELREKRIMINAASLASRRFYQPRNTYRRTN